MLRWPVVSDLVSVTCTSSYWDSEVANWWLTQSAEASSSQPRRWFVLWLMFTRSDRGDSDSEMISRVRVAVTCLSGPAWMLWRSWLRRRLASQPGLEMIAALSLGD